MENDLLNMESLKSDVNTIIQRLVQKIEKLIDKNESKDYSSDEESNYSSQYHNVHCKICYNLVGIKLIEKFSKLGTPLLYKRYIM